MRTRIVVLDGYTLNPGDLSWHRLDVMGDLIVHDRSEDPQLVERAAGAACLLTNKTPLTAQTIRQLPEARYIGVLATGTNVVDLQAARQQNIIVTNIPGYGAASVAQHVFALLLELTNHTGEHARAVAAGQWSRCPDFSFTVDTMHELAGKTLGIVGVGAIGQRVAMIGHALGMNIAAAEQRSMHDVDRKLPGINIAWKKVDDLLAGSDVITLHCPLTDQTRHLINAERLAKMKRSAYLINTGRGGLVDESALAKALHERMIAGAGLDVLSIEPPAAGSNPLLSAPRCVITPHCAWASIEARQRLMDVAADNLQAFLRGSPINVVN